MLTKNKDKIKIKKKILFKIASVHKKFKKYSYLKK